ncbi:MAG: TMEM165/GDT1 family protein [Candidatus Bathyarchaeota archaeon]|nr:TMEM165/GDT1 family protein [Candidatus Bathyarchaeota archaeon]
MDLTPLATTFTFVFLAELGDKTQLTVIMLSSKSTVASVFAGSMLAFFLVDGLSAVIGGELLGLLPTEWVSLISGLVFAFYGFFLLFRRDKEIEIRSEKATFLNAFSMISLMELGDKTQLASVLLAAEFKSPFVVLIGVMLAFSVVTGIGVVFGAKLLRFLPERYLRTATSLLFILIGFIFIIDAIAGLASLPLFLL